jgi:hypothetical protein
MSSPSNLYAEKVFAEYPLELWSLDDATDYVSLITESQRNITTGWTVSRTGIGSTSVSVTNVTSTFAEEDAPIQTSGIYKVLTQPAGTFTSNPATITLTSDTTFDLGLETEFAIGLSTLASPNTTGIRVGYKVGSSEVEWSSSYKTKDFVWSAISHTFSLAEPLPGPANIVIEISFSYSGTNGSQYIFYFNGISVGIRSEEFYATSTGIIPIEKPISFPITDSSVMVYPANPYSLSDNYGYYTVDNGSILRARNSTIPLVYGASNSTILSKADNGNPSLVIPGQGLFNDSGKGFIRTMECWIRLNSSGSEYRRIIGPVSSSTNGLYVHGPFMSLKVGDAIGSYFVGEWSRPMLIQIIIQEKTVSLKVNAETVITLDVEVKNESLEPSTNDWIGFYAYDDVTEFEVDCIAIYPYVVSDKVAKKRYVYGQGVVLPESTNTSYGGSSIVIDYSFADYDKNHSFPKNTPWSSGIVQNLFADKERIGFNNYSIPSSNFGKNTYDEWLSVMQNVEQDTEMTDIGRAAFYMKPTYYLDGGTVSVFDLGNPYFYMQNLDMLTNSRVSGISVIFKNNSAISDTDLQTLIYIEDYLTLKSFEICASSEDIIYLLNGVEIERRHVRDAEDPTIKAVAGINIDLFRNISSDAFSFFSDLSRLRLYIGGKPGTFNTFTGPLYEISLMSSLDVSKISSSFDSDGYATHTEVSEFETLIPAYKLVGTSTLGTFNLDISSSGYWEDYTPMTIFKKELTLEDGTTLEDVSMLQVNVDYPTVPPGATTYDTSNSYARFYVAFQNASDGIVMTSGRTDVSAKSNGVVIPGVDWETERYEIVDGMVIALPDHDDVDDLILIYSMEIKSSSISTTPVIIRSFEICSLTFDEQTLRPIGTKYGTKIYPFKEIEDESYVSSKDNYFKIYKGTTPYLYLTSKTGVSVVGDIKSPTDQDYVHRGIVAIINQDLAQNYDISSIMMSVRYQDKYFPTTKTPVFEIEGHIFDEGTIKNAYLRFYIQSVNQDNTRGRLFCEASISQGSFSAYENIVYYWNGNIVGYPQMSSGEWGMLAISFTNFIKFPAVSGTFEILGKLLVDNVSVYKISETTASSSTTINTWNTALYGSGTWGLVLDTDGTETPTNDPADDNLWFNTYSIVKTSTKPVDQTEIYRSYLGTNKIIVDTTDSNIAIRPESCEYVIYNAVEWKTSVLDAL